MTSPAPSTLAQLAAGLAAGRISSHALVTECLARITSPAGEGPRTFLKVYGEQALATADFYDSLRRRGAVLPAFAGIPVSIKDLFDVAGDTTTAASIVLKGTAAAAARDATVVARLKAAGFIVIGRTNMTEFAYSGLGLNPHYGTPLNPWDRATGRIPGGSSSGAAVSITDGMAFGALGTDTGGSCRIPAAMCGIVGYKPTARRVPRDGTFPLSTSLDSIGPLAHSVACCAALDAVLSNETDVITPPPLTSVRDLRLGVVSNYMTDGIDSVVAAGFQRALRALARAGARLSDIALPELVELTDLNSKGGLAAAEAFALHRARLATDGGRCDPRVATRILRGREQNAADYIDLLNRRESFIASVSARLAQFDAILAPTIPIVAPAVSELAADEAYWRLNGLVLRNPSFVNFLDGCAISIPCHEPGTAPVGLMILGLRNTDQHLFAVAAAAEGCLQA